MTSDNIAGDHAVPFAQLLRPAEAAERLAISKSKLYQMLGKGLLPKLRVGGAWRIPEGALAAWVMSNMEEGA